jgi:hypothetical protein
MIGSVIASRSTSPVEKWNVFDGQFSLELTLQVEQQTLLGSRCKENITMK